MKRIAIATSIAIFAACSLYLDRFKYEVADRAWYNISQTGLVALCLALTISLNGWLKVAAFAILSLTTVELAQQFINGNTEVNLSDNVSLIVVACGVIGFILLRRYQNKL